jgi:hypothetical protein
VNDRRRHERSESDQPLLVGAQVVRAGGDHRAAGVANAQGNRGVVAGRFDQDHVVAVIAALIDALQQRRLSRPDAERRRNGREDLPLRVRRRGRRSRGAREDVRGNEQLLAGHNAHRAENAVQTEDALNRVVVDLRLTGRDAVGGADRIRIRSSGLQELQLERDRRRIRVRDPNGGRELRTVRALNLAGGGDDEIRPGKAVGVRLLLCGGRKDCKSE